MWRADLDVQPQAVIAAWHNPFDRRDGVELDCITTSPCRGLGRILAVLIAAEAGFYEEHLVRTSSCGKRRELSAVSARIPTQLACAPQRRGAGPGEARRRVLSPGTAQCCRRPSCCRTGACAGPVRGPGRPSGGAARRRACSPGPRGPGGIPGAGRPPGRGACPGQVRVPGPTSCRRALSRRPAAPLPGFRFRNRCLSLSARTPSSSSSSPRFPHCVVRCRHLVGIRMQGCFQE